MRAHIINQCFGRNVSTQPTRLFSTFYWNSSTMLIVTAQKESRGLLFHNLCSCLDVFLQITAFANSGADNTNKSTTSCFSDGITCLRRTGIAVLPNICRVIRKPLSRCRLFPRSMMSTISSIHIFDWSRNSYSSWSKNLVETSSWETRDGGFRERQYK